MKKLTIPQEITEFVAKDAVLAISISGGKDSQALLKSVMDWYRAEGLSNKIFAIHADLGRAEWEQTPAFVEKLCKDLDVELVVVRSKKGDLQAQIEARRVQLEGQNKPHFPSALVRSCTSNSKTIPINEYLKQFDKVISIEGICWHESKAREKKERVYKRETMKKKALTWNAIIDYSIDDVWATYNQTTETYKEAQRLYRLTNEVPTWWNFHPAYAMGNQRLSCSICILGSKNDVQNGIKHNPEYAGFLAQQEKISGFSFAQGRSIAQMITQQNTQLF